jgi:hypothetical protein
MHLEDEEIQRLLHDELAEPARGSRLEHLGRCTACRERMERAGREEMEIFGLLARLDHAVPLFDPASLMRPDQIAPGRDWRRRAAVIVLFLGGAGVAYAAPGSPLPGWIRTIAVSLAGSHQPTSPPAPAPRAAVDEVAPPSGIAVSSGQRLAIAFEHEQSAGMVTLRVTDGPDVVVRAVHGSAAFRTDVARLTIANEGSTADYEIEVPRNAPWVEVLVSGRRVLLKHDTLVDSPIARRDRGAYVLPLHR